MFDIHQQVFDEDGERIEEAIEDYCNDLMQAFAESPEGVALLEHNDNLGWPHTFLHYGLVYLGTEVPEMSVGDVHEIVFDIFPRKVSVEADQAGDIIRELRAFWHFLGRQYDLPNAAAIVNRLNDEAEQQLEDTLSDPSNFGMAKSWFMMGNQAGFDMTSQEGLNAFMLAYNESLLTSRSPTPQIQDVPNVQVPLEGSTRIERPSSARIGRNDPCRCGSGKKYKKCCGRK